LLLQAWQILRRESRDFKLRLRVIGCSEEQLASLARDAMNLGIVDQVLFDPYVDDELLDRLMGTASALLLPSRFEGFGLPLLEAMRQGIPTMISPDLALQEVGCGHAACSAGWAPHQLAIAIRRAVNMTSDELLSARQHADGFTWRRTVELTRANLHMALRGSRS
jgi:glycosyltransferase involved in cell wall biosynthesis